MSKKLFKTSPPRFEDFGYEEDLVYRYDDTESDNTFEISKHIYEKSFGVRNLNHGAIKLCLFDGHENYEAGNGKKETTLIYSPSTMDTRTILVVGFDKDKIHQNGTAKLITVFDDDDLGAIDGSLVNKSALTKSAEDEFE